MTIDSPDDIGAAITPDVETDPVTDDRDIDWLRSITTKRIERTALQPSGEVKVEHVAYFGIRPETVADVGASYSRTIEFRPEFLTAEWNGGVLSRVQLTGPQRLKAGGVSSKITKDRRWSSGWSSGVREPVDKSGLPTNVAAALTAYETAVAVERNGARK